MEYHKCKLYQEGELFDDQAECWFEIVHEGQIKHAEGEIQSSKHIISDFISGKSEYEMLLNDGRKGKILITNMSNNPKKAIFQTSGPLE